MATNVVFYRGVNWGKGTEPDVEGQRYSAASVEDAHWAGLELLKEWKSVVISDWAGSLLMVVGR